MDEIKKNTKPLIAIEVFHAGILQSQWWCTQTWLTSSHNHIKIITKYRTTITQKRQKSSQIEV